MRHFCCATSDVERGAGEFLDAEGVKADAGAYDVYDRVDGADFVKMNLLKGHVVNAGFGFAQFFEDSGSALAHLRSEPRFFEDFEDRTEGAMLGLILCFDFDVGGGHAGLPDFFGGESPARDLQAAQFGAEMHNVAAGVNQGTESHVAANARKTIEISEFHGGNRSAVGLHCLLGLSAGYKLILSTQRKTVKRPGHSCCL